ncbi:hypothetical protein ENSA5_65870 [Enhygromyxa salina]|uniref:Lipoprotein n=1 Tax=Enhygromyxa salina TaxID=215803 RepID=A0A2S9XC87_9BACT|nr:hypothetical protein [Enhygromyxa salina]PRP90291.1 hypothetical protein ENSA5_65870 [Enhygromyxa salina]
MRTTLIAAALLLAAGCADAPITAADLQADGQLRESNGSQQSVHAASETNPKTQQAAHLRVTGLVAAEADGPLEDATRFSLDSEAIYLHLRADDLVEPRPVTFVWLHGDHQRETMGFLQPSETVSLAANLPLARFLEEGWNGLEPPDPEAINPVEPDPLAQTGGWRVEVYTADQSGRSLVFERDFEILTPEAFEAMTAEDALGASN